MRTIFFLLFTLSFSVAAMDRKPLAVVAITTQQAEIRSGVQAGTGRYKDMPAKTRGELLSRQSELLAMLEGKTSVEELSETERFEAFNNLEWIEAAINNAESERMVCNREKTLGSNRLQRVCKTMAQRKAEIEAARQNIDRGCPAGICGVP